MRSIVLAPAVILLATAVLTWLPGCGEGIPEDATDAERFLAEGRRVYARHCMSCHQADAQGLPSIYPPLTGTEWVLGDPGRLIRIVLHGVQGPTVVHGERYDGLMIPHAFLSDTQVAAVLTFVRSNFGNDAPAIMPEQVQAVRAAEGRRGIWQARDLEHATGIPRQESDTAPEQE
jgi:mono/diheme cytochrome c family protein